MALLLADWDSLCEDGRQAVLRVFRSLREEIPIDVVYFTEALAPATVTTKMEQGCRIYQLGIPRGVRESLEVIGDFLRLLQKKYRYGLFHAFCPVYSGYMAAVLGKYEEVPVILDLRRYELEKSLWSPSLSPFCEWTLRHVSCIRVTSEELKRRVSIFSPLPVEVIREGVDIHLFQRRKSGDLGLPGEKRLAFFVDPYTKEGLRSLLHAFQLIQGKKENVHLLLFGDLETEEELLIRQFQTSLLGVLHKRPFPKEEELPYYLSQVHLVVVPALRGGVPLLALQSLACGTPVVAFQIGEFEELVELGGMPDLLAPPGNPRLLAVKILEGLECETVDCRWIRENIALEKEIDTLKALYRRWVPW